MRTWNTKLWLAGAVVAAVGCSSDAALDVASDAEGTSASPLAASAVEVTAAVQHDVSPPLRDMPPAAPAPGGPREHPLRPLPVAGEAPDTALQLTPGAPLPITTKLDIAGVGNGDYGFSPDAAPPDTNGAVGATQYVQWVNESFAVFDKTTGAKLYGPAKGNTLWSGFGGGCETNNDGDPIVEWDGLANRWVMTQFSVSTKPYLECVAVSKTSDATGQWNRYAFSYGNTEFNDYPKLGVWPDAYYTTYNIFNGSGFAGAKLCALDRAKMLFAQPATQQCFQLSSSYGGVLPADVDGAAPPVGSPEYFVNFGSNSLNEWKMHVDFADSANTTLTGPLNVAVASFAPACGGGACITQPGTKNQLDSLGDRLMHRLAYRNFGDHESMVVNHSVKVSGNRRTQVVGVRWYELRNPNGDGGAEVYQQGTYSPDGTSRWMGSVAMDKNGDIALGYSVSSGTIKPGIRFTGRVPGDALGTLEAESTIINGGGSQTGRLDRWGDYSAMTVDPVDGCTFYYTNEYLKSSGTFNWSTRIASFRFTGCTTP